VYLRRRDVALVPAFAMSRPVPVLVFAVALNSFVLCWTLLRNAPVNFDSLAYHLPMIADWVREGGLLSRPELGQVNYYSFHWEVFAALNVALLGGDAFVAWPNVLAWIMVGILAFSLGRRLGATDASALVAAALVLATPELLRRAVAIQPDMPMAMAFLAVLLFGGIASGRRHRWAFAASLGLLAGVKTSGLIYAGLACTILLLDARLRGVSFVRPARRHLAPAALAVFLIGFWSIRNVLAVGNPLGLVEIALGGWTLLEGRLDAELLRRGTLAATFHFGDAEHWKIFWRAMIHSMAWPLVALLLLACVGAVRRASVATTVWAILAVLSFIAYFYSPFSADNGERGYLLTPWLQTNVRFAFCFLVALAPLAALGIDALGRFVKILVALMALGYLGWGCVDVVLPRYPILLGCVLMTAFATVFVQLPQRRSVLLPGAVLLMSLFVGFSYSARNARHASRHISYGSAYEYLQRHFDDRVSVGYAMTQQRYPWVGPRLQRRVVSAVPRGDDAAAWFEQLERDSIDVLMVGTTSSAEAATPGRENVRRWLDLPGAPFVAATEFESQRRDVQVYRRR
jgi:hypothetical protein